MLEVQALVAADTAELQCLGRCVERLLISPDQNICDVKQISGCSQGNVIPLVVLTLY